MHKLILAGGSPIWWRRPSQKPLYALSSLGDRTPLTNVLRGHLSGDSRARSSSAATLPVRLGGVFSRAFFFPLSYIHEKVPSSRGAHAFRGGGAPTIPYMRPESRRQDLSNGRFRVEPPQGLGARTAPALRPRQYVFGGVFSRRFCV